MLRDLIINALCLVSIIGGSAATALSVEGERAERHEVAAVGEKVVVAALKPEHLTAWSTAIANAIPVVAASLLLVWSNYRATKRRIEAEDAAAAQDPHLPELPRSKDQDGGQEGQPSQTA